jgi:hypothetical protein
VGGNGELWSSFTPNLGTGWTAVVIFRPRLVYVKKQKVSRHPLKAIGGLGACLGASEKGKHSILQNVSANINILAISMKTFFFVFLTAHLRIILVINQPNVKNLIL